MNLCDKYISKKMVKKQANRIRIDQMEYDAELVQTKVEN